MRPAAHLLFFASPKKRSKRSRSGVHSLRAAKLREHKGDPTGRVPCASLRGNLRCSRLGRCCGTRFVHCVLFAQTTAASQSTKHGHAALPMPAPAAALLGTARGDPKTRPAIAALGHALPCGAERSDGPCETPCGCACGAALAGWRVHRRMHALRALTRRGCLNGARQRAVSSAAHPESTVTQVCPAATRRGRRLGVAFSLPSFLWRSKRK